MLPIVLNEYIKQSFPVCKLRYKINTFLRCYNFTQNTLIKFYKILQYSHYSISKKGCWGTRWRSWSTHCAASWVRFPMVSFEFFIDIILPAAL